MEHIATQSQFDITSEMDFVIPLKQVGLITRSVLESLFLLYRPRRVIVVTCAAEACILTTLLPYWSVGRVEIVREETYFQKNFNLTLPDILAQYDASRSGDHREPGWWLQQLIKLGAATQIANLSDDYVVWDGDLVPIRRWRLCERDIFGNIRHFIAILQGEARSVFNTSQYSACMKELLGCYPVEPPTGGTFVAHHMIFNKACVGEMLCTMGAHTGSSLPWPLLIMSQSRRFFRFSEYKSYSSFMLRNHPTAFHYHDLRHFGEGGLRFRDANAVIRVMLQSCPVSGGGFSYTQVKEFVGQHWRSLSSESTAPAYIQLDHVYGLGGVDLGLWAAQSFSVPAAKVARFSTPLLSSFSLPVNKECASYLCFLHRVLSGGELEDGAELPPSPVLFDDSSLTDGSTTASVDSELDTLEECGVLTPPVVG